MGSAKGMPEGDGMRQPAQTQETWKHFLKAARNLDKEILAKD